MHDNLSQNMVYQANTTQYQKIWPQVNKSNILFQHRQRKTTLMRSLCPILLANVQAGYSSAANFANSHS